MSDDIQERWVRTEREGVQEVVDQAARRITSRYADAVELDDARQEAMIALVMVPSLVTLLREDELELGLLQHRLEQALTWRHARGEQRRVDHSVPLSRIDGEDTEESATAVFSPAPPITSDYNRDSVEELLPAVWDESYVYGLPKKITTPDPDMPRGTANPKTANNLPAYIADIKTGWAKASLTHRERRALLMRYGLAWTQEEIAEHENVHHTTISHRLFAAVGKIVARLNAGIWYELEGVEV